MISALKKSNQIQNLSVVLGRRHITSKRLTQPKDDFNKTKASMNDILARRKGGLGILKMNREHRQNMLTPNFIKQVKRGVETMYIDHGVELIYLTTEKGLHFSNGTDFRTILHHKANKETDKVVDYMGQIYDLQATVAKINKPLMSVAPGNVFNSGASLFVASGIPHVTDSTNIIFNEVQYGFVPHAGSTYYLSRLPGDFGTFLALTGFPMSGKDALNLKMADGLVDYPVEHIDRMVDVMMAFDPTENAKMSGPQVHNLDYSVYGKYTNNKLLENVVKYQEQLDEMDQFLRRELDSRLDRNMDEEEFVDPKERKPDIIAEADIEYENMLKNYSQNKYGTGGIGYFEHDAFGHNFYQDVTRHVLLGSGDQWEGNSMNTLLKHKQLINRCFYPDNLKEIMKNLRQETDPFAKEILNRMQQNSKLSMKLALKMLRKAKNMSYGEVLKMEQNVSLNKIKDAEFDSGVSEILMKPRNNKGKPQFEKDVTDQKVESYFEENPHLHKIDLNIVENSLLPTRHFFEKYVDSMRVYLNETSTPQSNVRFTVEYEIPELLRKEGINMLDKTMTIPLARRIIYKKHRQEEFFSEYISRSMQLLTDSKLREQYGAKVKYELKQLENENLFYEHVNNNIAEIFETAYLERLQKISLKCHEAQQLEKRRFFLRIKKFLLTNRMMQYHTDIISRLQQRIDNLPYKFPHLTENWEQSIRDVEHPDLQQSVMWHLSKVVGKAYLAPNFLMQQYLTDPEAAKNMQTYVFDKEALQKLRKDLLLNPQKYIDMLAQEKIDYSHLNERDLGQFWEMKNKRFDNLQFFFRLENDGRSAHNYEENWVMQSEYLQYKQWVENIKNQTFGTLQLVVQKLLNDFETNIDLKNQVVDFEQFDQETNHQSLKRLLVMLNEEVADPLKLDTGDNKAKSQDNKKRTNKLNDKELFDQLLEQDQHLKALFMSDLTSNQMISSFRDELKNDMFTLLKVVLLEKTDKPLTEVVDSNRKLWLIDTYLGNEAGMRVLKQAIEIVKPFFFYIARNRIDEEATRLLTQFKYQENKFDAMALFFYFKTFPHRIGQKMRVPDKSTPKERQDKRQEWRELLDMFNVPQSGKLKDTKELDKKIQILEESAKKQYERLYNHFDKIQATLDHEQKEQINEQNEQMKDWDRLIEDDYVEVNPEDQPEISMQKVYFQKMEDFVLQYKHEIETTTSLRDWLEIYANNILDNKVNMHSLIQDNRHQEKYIEDGTFLNNQILNINAYYGTKDAKWEDFAAYSNFLKQMYDESLQLQKHATSEKNFYKIVDFLQIDKTQPVETKDSVWKSLFKFNDKSSTNQSLLKEVNDLQSLAEKMQSQQRFKKQILQMSQSAPKHIRDEIGMVINNQFLKTSALRQYLQAIQKQSSKGRDWKNCNVSSFVDISKVADQVVHNHKDVLDQFSDTSLDVLTLSGTKGMIEKANIEEASKNNLLLIINQIQNELQFVSNERRMQLKLGEFLQKHTNSHKLRQYSNDMLSNLIKDKFGDVKKDGENELNSEMIHPASNHSKQRDVHQLVTDIASGQSVASIQGAEYQKQTYRDAMQSLELSQEMTLVRNHYENLLLQEYSYSKLNQEKVEHILNEYTQIRINDAMQTPLFAKGANNEETKPLYMKLLRESIIDELRLTNSMDLSDLYHDNHAIFNQHHRVKMDYLAESVYNLNHVNNEEAIGFKNIKERVANPTKNKELAHDSIFDKVLAEYFLQKRSDVKQSNSLLKELETLFDKELQANPNTSNRAETKQNKTLGHLFTRQTEHKEDQPRLPSEMFPALFDLDLAVNKRLHYNMGSIATKVRDIDHQDWDIPEYFDSFDVRKPADKFVLDQLRRIMDQLFESRRKVEKYMSRSELLAFDNVLHSYLKYENLMPKLKREVEKELNTYGQLSQMALHSVDGFKSIERQLQKKRGDQDKISKNVENEDAYFKLLAYAGNLEIKRRENQKETNFNVQINAGEESFDKYYMDILKDQAMIKPQPIDEDALKPKSRVEIEKHGAFMNQRERQANFFEDYKLYKENKWESHQRNQLQSIFEHLHQEAEVSQDDQKLRNAGQYLKDYFNNPSNTNLSSKGQ